MPVTQLQEKDSHISTVERVLFLKDVDLFQDLSGEDLSHIALITDVVEFAPQATIFHSGDLGDAMYLIVDGRIRVDHSGHVVRYLGAKDCFGEMSILDDAPRASSATAIDGVRLLKIHRDDFADIVSDNPDIAHGVIKVLTRKLREAIAR